MRCSAFCKMPLCCFQSKLNEYDPGIRSASVHCQSILFITLFIYQWNIQIINLTFLFAYDKAVFLGKCLLLLLQTALIHVLRRMRLQCDAFWAVTQSQYFINPSQPHVTTLDVSCGCHRQLMHTASCALNLLHRGRQQWGKSRKRGKRKKWVKLNSKQLMSEPCARCQFK